jgi:uncharacterized FlaG/YvyC family protein
MSPASKILKEFLPESVRDLRAVNSMNHLFTWRDPHLSEREYLARMREILIDQMLPLSVGVGDSLNARLTVVWAMESLVKVKKIDPHFSEASLDQLQKALQYLETEILQARRRAKYKMDRVLNDLINPYWFVPVNVKCSKTSSSFRAMSGNEIFSKLADQRFPLDLLERRKLAAMKSAVRELKQDIDEKLDPFASHIRFQLELQMQRDVLTTVLPGMSKVRKRLKINVFFDQLAKTQARSRKRVFSYPLFVVNLLGLHGVFLSESTIQSHLKRADLLFGHIPPYTPRLLKEAGFVV